MLNGSSTLDKARVEELIAEGLAVWAPHGKLHFHKKEDEGRADIELSFAAGSHGDGLVFSHTHVHYIQGCTGHFSKRSLQE